MLLYNRPHRAWGVAIGEHIGSHFPLSAAVFDARTDAEAFRRELQKHLPGHVCRVVRVSITVQLVKRAKRKAAE